MGADSTRITVPVSRFASGDFPRICAMTGLPAETARKFTFSSLRWWPLAVLPFGGLWGHAAVGLIERRATGALPLTRSSDRRVGRAGWQGWLFIGAGLLSFAAIVAFGIAIGPHAFDAMQATLAGIVWLLGLLALIGGAVYLVAARYLVGPRGTVHRKAVKVGDATVEIWKLHPAFVAAVKASNPQELDSP